MRHTKLAIVSSHPVQYAAPVFQLLATKVTLKVFYTGDQNRTFDKGFQRHVRWDIPMLAGYDNEWILEGKGISQLSSFQPTCLLVYGWTPKGHLRLLKYYKNKVYILFMGDSTLLKKLPWWKDMMKKAVLTWVYQHVDMALYVGTHNKSYFKKYGLKESQLKFAPAAIDNDRFSVPQSGQMLRKHLGLASTDLLVLFAGKFSDNKNVLMLLRAFTTLNIKNSHLLFVGQGILEDELKKEAGRHRNVHVMPFQNQQAIPAFYQACDVFCLPSKSESWGLAINEAMACAKAVLVSDQCGAAVDLVTEKNGRVFKSNQLSDLKRQLQYLLNNPMFLKVAGKCSKEIIAKWNYKVQVENILNCLYV